MPRPADPASPARLRMYDFIVKYKTEHDGNSPSIRKIMEASGISSSSVVYYHLQIMVGFGMIERHGHSINVIGGQWIPPARNGS